MSTRLGLVLPMLAALAFTSALAQNAGRSSGPFLKLNDLWLVYTRPAMLVERGRVWVPARPFAAVAGMAYGAGSTKSGMRLSFSGHELKFEVGGDGFSLDGKNGSFGETIRSKDGEVMIPVDMVAKAFGLSFRWDKAHNIAFLTGQGLATELQGASPSARFALIESRTGIDAKVPQVINLYPTSFQWLWKHGFYPSPTVNPQTVDLKTGSGFRLSWQRTGPAPKRTFVVMGLGSDDPTNALGYVVSGYGQFGFPYTGDKDPNDREYCKSVGSLSLVCDVGPVLYSEPNRYPTEPKVVMGIPRFVFARAYTF